MPDISMCPDEECPKAPDCHRSPKSGTKPWEWQTWFAESPRKGEACEMFWKSWPKRSKP